MTTDKIIEMAMELGTAIAQTKEIDALKEVQAKLDQDQDASSLITQYQEARTKLENKMRDGLEILPAEENNLEVLEQQLNSNPIIQELIQVQEKLNNLMQGVYFAMNQAISGEGCTSDCSTCGGSCGM